MNGFLKSLINHGLTLLQAKYKLSDLYNSFSWQHQYLFVIQSIP